MKVNILGTDYRVIDSNEIEHPRLRGADGYCDFTTKEIVIGDISEENGYEWGNTEYHRKKVIRHEIIHAFLYESGLTVNSEWAPNEEMVDWIAIQISKLNKAFEELSIN